MSFQKAIFISLGVGSALVLGGCGAKDTNPNPEGTAGTAGVPASTGGTTGVAGAAATGGMAMAGGGTTGGAGASTSGVGTSCATTNLAAYMPNQSMPISFQNDLLPMFGLSCILSDCHNSAENAPRAGLQLGHKCDYNATAKWKCVFPTTVTDPSNLISASSPDDPATVMAVYQSLMAPSTTVNGGGMVRVKPGDPANSFLMLKLAGTENMHGLMCTNQDPSHGTGAACGDPMPLGGTQWCDGSDRPKFDAIAQWIANGAMMN